MLNLLHGPTLTLVHDYWKTKALTPQTFVSKAMSLLFNMLSRFARRWEELQSILESLSEAAPVTAGRSYKKRGASRTKVLTEKQQG